MRYRSQDGLMSSSDPSAVETWDGIGREMDNEQQAWSARLRSIGVKLEHPDDGWVHEPGRGYSPNNPEKWLSLSWYARFNDDPQVGDIIALGSPRDGYRLVRVTHIKKSTLLIESTHYYYEDTGQRLPEVKRIGRRFRAPALRAFRKASR